MNPRPAARARAPIPIRPVSQSERPTSLPLPLTSFVGRDREIGEIAALVCRAGVRLVTLSGPGGVGKTRLAIRVAEEVTADFPDGVWFVPLASIADPAHVASGIARVVDPEDAGQAPPERRIAAFFRSRRALLVLDNAEHVIEAFGLVAELLAACPALTVLVTSRESLRISGEHLVAVPPLNLSPTPAIGAGMHDPANTSEAVQLFAERAAAVDRDFELTPKNSEAIAAICHRLDGLPLAIELAAARAATLPPAGLLTLLDRRLPYLAGGPRDAPPRLRSMRDAVAWSYELLPPAEQSLFRRLSVFVGGFTLEAAEAIGGTRDASSLQTPHHPTPTVVDGVASLVSKSLVRRTDGLAGPRYGLLETIREYGLEQLAESGEESAVREALANWCVALAERAQPELIGPWQAEWNARLEDELGNLRAALAWLHRQGRASDALRLAENTALFWMVPGRFDEALRLFDQIITMPGSTDEPALLARALQTAASAAHWLDDHDGAIERYRRSFEISDAIGDRLGMGMALRGFGSVAIDQGNPAAALDSLRQALAIFSVDESPWNIARTNYLIGLAHYVLGDLAAAADSLEGAVTLWRGLGDHSYVATGLTYLAAAELERGELLRALIAARESLEIASAVNDQLHVVRAVERLGQLAAEAGDVERSILLLSASKAHRARLGVGCRLPEKLIFERYAERLRTAEGETRFASAWERGRDMPLDEAVELANAIATTLSSDEEAGAESIVPLPFGLSSRQAEVLRLVAQHLTDREIAERLFISPRTVSKHLEAIFAKLGVASRREAAAIARRHGLR